MERMAIIGLGLMGGSLGLSVKAKTPSCVVSGYTRSAERGKMAKRRKVIDELHGDICGAVAGADLVVYCAPILTIPQLVRESRPALKPGCVLTDVGSTKAYLAAEIPPLLKDSGVSFVGSHPLCGSEKQGIQAARKDLYRGAAVILTPTKQSSADRVEAVRTFWQGVEAVVHEMDPLEHDRVVCRTSHLPHMVASLLAATVARSGGLDRLAGFCGSGFRDTTRIAEGAAEVWGDILKTNRANVAEELRAFRIQLDHLVELLDRGDFDGVEHFLERGRVARRALAGDKLIERRRRP